MTSDDAVRITRRHIESKFPKTCSSCGRTYTTLADYLRQTRHVGQPVSYDVELGDWAPRDPLGTQSFANCICGSTMIIDSHGMTPLTMARLLRWGRAETRRRGISMRELLEWVRAQVDQQVLREYDISP